MILSAWKNTEASRLVVCTVHELPNAPADRIERAERLVFVKDGFSWVAALFTPFWLLANRMWVVFAGYMVLLTLVSVVLDQYGLRQEWLGLVNLAVGVIFGFEADSLKRWTLERYGAEAVGTVAGRSMAECERRFFDDWLPRQPVLRTLHEHEDVPPDLAGLGQMQSSGPAEGRAKQKQGRWLQQLFAR